MPYGTNREDSLPIVFHLTGEDAITQNAYWERRFALYYIDDVTGEQTLWEFDGVMAGGFAGFKSSLDSGSNLIFLHTSNGGVVLGPAGPDPEEQFSFKLVVEHDNAEVNALDDVGRMVWDIYVLDGTGRHIRLYQGDAALNRNVT